MSIQSSKKIILIAALAFCGGGIGYYYTHRTSCVQEAGPIYTYNAQRDRADLLEVFNANRNWLLSSPDYDPEFMLDYKAPNRNPLYLGKAYIKVLRENGNFVGFTLYYKKTLTEGMLLFLAIGEKYRNKGYAKKLVQYVLDDFKCMGMKVVTLLTRTFNHPAQKVYNSMGFTETSRDEKDGYVYYEKIINP